MLNIVAMQGKVGLSLEHIRYIFITVLSEIVPSYCVFSYKVVRAVPSDLPKLLALKFLQKKATMLEV